MAITILDVVKHKRYQNDTAKFRWFTISVSCINFHSSWQYRYRNIFPVENWFSNIKQLLINRNCYPFVTEVLKMGIRKLFLPRTELEYERHRVDKSRSNKNYETLKRHHHHHHQHRSSGKSSRSVRGSSRRHKRRHKFFDLVRFELRKVFRIERKLKLS